MTRDMRKLLAALLILIAVGSLVGLIGSATGLVESGRPMLFARALVVSVGLLLITLRWPARRRRVPRTQSSRKRG